MPRSSTMTPSRVRTVALAAVLLLAVAGFSACEEATPRSASTAGDEAAAAARSQVGTPYQWGGREPGVGFDCSGLTSWSWEQAGVALPHQSFRQYEALPHIPIQEARPGDLIFYYSPISHVGMYIGNGQLVNAANTGTLVKVATVNWGKVTGVGRPG